MFWGIPAMVSQHLPEGFVCRQIYDRHQTSTVSRIVDIIP